MTTTRTPSGCCPSCNTMINAASALRADAQPQPGDITVCAYCFEVFQFGPDMKLVPADEDQVRYFEENFPHITRIRNEKRAHRSRSS